MLRLRSCCSAGKQCLFKFLQTPKRQSAIKDALACLFLRLIAKSITTTGMTICTSCLFLTVKSMAFEWHARNLGLPPYNFRYSLKCFGKNYMGCKDWVKFLNSPPSPLTIPCMYSWCLGRKEASPLFDMLLLYVWNIQILNLPPAD